MRLASALLALWAAAPALALDPARPLSTVALASWGEASGLPHHTVQALAQTPDGYLWVGTLEGLARFDGAEFRSFDRANTPALARNDVQALRVSRDGTLWVATYGGGLVRYRDGHFEPVAIPGLAVTVTDLGEDGQGTLWIASSSGLHSLRGGVLATLTRRDGLAHDVVRSVFPDRSGALWVGSNGGLDRWAEGQVTHFGRAEGLPGEIALAIGEDAGGNLWVGTERGAARREGGRFVVPPDAGAAARESVAAFLLDRRGAFWIATDHHLLRQRDGAFDVLPAALGLPGEGLSALIEDAEGSLWVGGGRGLTRLHESALSTWSRLQGLSSDSILTVAPAADGGLWLGGSEGTIDRFVGGRGVPLPHVPAPGAQVLALLEDREGRLWAGTDVGLHLRVGERWKTLGPEAGLATGPVRSLLEDRSGRLWVGTDGAGLGWLEGERLRLLTRDDGLPSNQVRDMLETRDGALLVATYGGLARVQDGRVAEPPGAAGLRGVLARSLHEDAEGALWVGTYGSGLYRLAGGQLLAVTSREGLPSDVVYAVLEDDRGHLWTSSNKGIASIFRPEVSELAAGRVREVRPVAFGRGDGLRSGNGGRPAAAKDGQGRLWFATEGGVASVDPVAALRPGPLPPPRIEEVEVDGQLVRGGAVELGPDARRLRIHFRCPSLVAAQRTRFSFLLEGFDADWVDAGHARSAVFTGLRPGDHRLRVRASRDGAGWVEMADPLSIRVRARWYHTLEARFAGLGLTAAALAAAYRVRVRRLEARQRELKEKVEDAVANLKVLQGLLPICSTCKKIRDDKGEWSRLEVYIRDHSEAEFTHGICPECMERLYPEQARKIRARQQQG